jgi:hypothetical protein
MPCSKCEQNKPSLQRERERETRRKAINAQRVRDARPQIIAKVKEQRQQAGR